MRCLVCDFLYLSALIVLTDISLGVSSTDTQQCPGLQQVNVNAENYSALCAVVKDENAYIKEWVQYHKCLGVKKIYIYDHNSQEALSGELLNDIQSGYVVYTSNTTGLSHVKYNEGFSSNLDRFMTTIQGQVYKDCLEKFGSQHAFMGFIDVDEYLVFHDPSFTDINTFLSRYQCTGGVSLYWVLLGSSGHAAHPPGVPVIEAYQRCTPFKAHANTQFKSFVNTAAGPSMYSPHRATFAREGVTLVDEHMVPIAKGRHKSSTHELASVYHYATRSMADFKAKLRRGGGAGVTRPRHYIDRLDKACTETCTDAVKTLARSKCGGLHGA